MLQLPQFNEAPAEHTFRQINLTFLSQVCYKVESSKVPSLSCWWLSVLYHRGVIRRQTIIFDTQTKASTSSHQGNPLTRCMGQALTCFMLWNTPERLLLLRLWWAQRGTSFKKVIYCTTQLRIYLLYSQKPTQIQKPSKFKTQFRGLIAHWNSNTWKESFSCNVTIHSSLPASLLLASTTFRSL